MTDNHRVIARIFLIEEAQFPAVLLVPEEAVDVVFIDN